MLVTGLFFILSILGGAGFMLFSEAGSQSVNVFVFSLFMAISVFTVRILAFWRFGPPLRDVRTLGKKDVAIMLAAGGIVALSDLFFYVALTHGVNVSLAMPLVFIATLLIVAFLERILFQAELHAMQWIGIVFGIVSIFCLSGYV